MSVIDIVLTAILVIPVALYSYFLLKQFRNK